MKLIVKKYHLNNRKIKTNKKICLVSDFHISNIFNDKKIDMFLSEIKNKKIDYVCIVGDYIDCTNMLEDIKLYDKSIKYLEKISSISKTVFVLGNHDLYKIGKNKKRSYCLNEKWINDVSKVNNLIFLNNNIYEDDDIRFIGYTAPFKYYKKFNEDQDLLVKDFNKVMPNINDDKYNILLFHSPIRILSKKSIENINALKNINLILSGHMHNALTPNFIDKIWKSNIGLVSPHKYLFPNNARGIKKKSINNHDIYLIISGGITKVHEVAPKILHFLDKFYDPEVTYINIDKI